MLLSPYPFLISVFTVSFLVSSETPSSKDCSREGSRLVRQVLEKNFFPVFESHGINMSTECPLRKSRDLYFYQEKYKTFEHNAKWTCDVCGKSFYKQEYVDLHMERKHSNLLVKDEDSPVCLEDYCKLFRCEAIRHSRRKTHFWNKVLCNKETMKSLEKKCLNLVQSCMPDMNGVYKQIYDEIVEETCSLINCKEYWQPLHYELSSLEILYYIIFTPLFISVLISYYSNIWGYYYDDEGIERDNETNKNNPSKDIEEIPGLRNRFTASRFDY